jgi:hypothetical protein
MVIAYRNEWAVSKMTISLFGCCTLEMQHTGSKLDKKATLVSTLA